MLHSKQLYPPVLSTCIYPLFTRNFHRSDLATCDPQEDDAVVLEHPDVELAHLIVGHRAVGQVLVDLPGWVRHDDPELAQDGHVEGADVTIDPLRLWQRLYTPEQEQ